MVPAGIRAWSLLIAALLLPACGGALMPLPRPFQLTTPSSGAGDVELNPTYAWTKSAHANSYTLEVATDPAFNALVVNEPGLISTSRSPVVTLAPSTIYYWRVLAVNATGTRLAQNAPRSFMTLPPLPDSFALQSPSDGATKIALSPTFSWAASSGADSYALQVSTSPGFGTLVIDQEGIGTTTFPSTVTLNPSTLYYWRVTAVNIAGSTLSSASPFFFTTGRALSVSGGPLTFSASTSGPNPPSQNLSVTNPGGVAPPLEWTVSADQPWLQFSPGAGSTLAETDAITVTAVVSQSEAWTASLTTTNAPNGQEDGSAVWTGKEMIVWGGHGPIGTMVNTGARYDPAADAWTGTTSLVGAPTPRWGHSAVWTGRQMIVWGGAPGGGSPLADGYRYDPVSNTWSGPISTVGAPSPRRVHTAVWTGSEMIIWGGLTDFGAVDTGARYNPENDTWSPISMVNAPSAKSYHSAVWTGSEMIVWGGDNNLGKRYHPATDTWGTATSTVGAPVRNNPCVVWTGAEMIVWSGFDGSTQPDTGVRYHAATDTWQDMTTANAPVGRRSGVAVWTGLEMIIWGGFDGAGFNNTGKRYMPPVGLGPGSYLGTLTIADPDAVNSPQTVSVTFNVGP